MQLAPKRMLYSNEIKNEMSAMGYELSHKIGEGGFGSVYKAEYKKTGQSVAIKFLHLDPKLDEKKRQREIARFERESQFVSKFNHPNIVRLLDKGSITTHSVYSVFEYVEGISLSEYLKSYGALDIEHAHTLMLQVLDALVHAHQYGIIHRDIKPSNIILSQTGAKSHVKLLDFGISTQTFSQRTDDYQTLTLNQETLGTPTYCTPEQLRGELVTFSSDLYMWGLVFLECLTGEPAVSGAGIAEIYYQQLSDVPIPIPQALLSHPLGELLRRVLQKRVSDRVVTAQDVFRQLDKMVVSNLVGAIQPKSGQDKVQHDDQTIALRQDDSDYLPVFKTVSTQKKQITALALRIVARGVDPNSSQADVVETVFNATRNQCVDIARRYGAFHVGNLSDLTLLYFGYPVASDNDARFAARTALEIISLANKQQSHLQHHYGCRFRFHLAIHSDLYWVRNNQVPDGFANHIVSDLSRLARDRSILCSGDSEILLKPFYQLEKSPLVSSENEGCFELKSERVLEAFGFLRGVRNQQHLIGRAHELKQLRAFIDDSTKNVIHIYGEAGIGKTRFIQEFRQLELKRAQLIFQCLPEYQSNALYPVLTLIKHVLLKSAVAPARQLSELMSKGSFIGPANEIKTILLAWLNIECSEKEALSSLDPAIQKSLLFEGLLYLLSQTCPQEVVYIFEDIHWADSITLEFIGFLNAQNITCGSKVITTSRQSLPDILKNNLFSSIVLQQLPLSETSEFIVALFDGVSVSHDVMNVLLSRTDGIPLFIEELVFMLKRHQITHVDQGQVRFVDQERINTIPLTLRESIQNKVDGLNYAKDTLQLAATIGREFDYHLLIEASPLSDLQIQHDLEEMIESQIIIQQRKVDGDSYLFKHALVWEISYDSIHWKTREELHELVAETLMSITPQPDRFASHQIAQHFQNAGQAFKASWWYESAASKASAIYAVDDAIQLYQDALTLCGEYEADPERNELYQRILEGYTANLIRNGQHINAREPLAKLIAMLHQTRDYQMLAETQLALGKTFEVVHHHEQALEYYSAAQQSLSLCEHASIPTPSPWWKTWLELKSAELYVHYWLSNPENMQHILSEVEPVALEIADHRQLAKYYDNVLHLYLRDKRYILGETELDVAKKALYASEQCGDQLIHANALFVLGFCYCHIQESQSAQEYLMAALALAETYQDRVLQTRCCTYLTVAYRLIGNVKRTREFASRSLQLAEETTMDDYVAAALANLSWSSYSENNFQQSIDELDQCLEKWGGLISRYPFPFLWLSHLHAIALCQVDEMFAHKYLHQVPNLAKNLLDESQAKLTPEIDKCLIRLSETEEDCQKIGISDLIDIARTQRFI
ncbi:protein kinase domain-containing protein [Photobacterium atrarenae]|uniref:Protein kinase n=1 Tax=Photobacterium atrarenae TaxID=865757 RepID=A0ABY5GNL8_9GAMM|nr:protein kinase [Photobacterium atrarenae]UTV30675.1 protein kinase [Photobacterium atrarenae]